ncbi:nuclear transport factor 2 family protein [Formosa haliotis]|uniref:nuclear transport factor 2 family protein n=1 Tax=Formosa haliotis TaxID=1555194 RepID=UPI0008270A98|nr:nuclear transport factor 2 family protein [Formosa haliotis]
MQTENLITKFYTSFSNGDINGMLACYHKEVVFQDPVFGKLKGERAFKMWEMLLSQKKETTIITFQDVQATTECGSANWVATYLYGDKKRKVTNRVHANFKFKDGKIIEHIDTFDLWTWTKQAMGVPGYLLGWTAFMKHKIQETTNKNLDRFIEKTSK